MFTLSFAAAVPWLHCQSACVCSCFTFTTDPAGGGNLCPKHPCLQELQDKSSRLVDAERRFSRLEGLMQRIALRTGCPRQQQYSQQQQQQQQQQGQQHYGQQQQGQQPYGQQQQEGACGADLEGLGLASASLLAGRGGARWGGGGGAGGGGGGGELGGCGVRVSRSAGRVDVFTVHP